VEFEEQATGIAEDGADLVSSPERSGRGSTVLARRLCGFAIVSSHCRHVDEVGSFLLSARLCDKGVRDEKIRDEAVGQPKRATCASAI
jgi:hypothetical protein